MNTLLMAIIVVVGVPALVVAYIVGTEYVLRLVPETTRPRIRPWLWVAPAFLFLITFLIYPTIRTFIVSLMNARGDEFVGLDNYLGLFSSGAFWQTLLNNALWIVFFTGFVVIFGIVIAVLTDRVRYETVVKAVIFIPMAISFVAAGVIWGFMYNFDPNIGTVNALITAVGGEPLPLLLEWPRNTFLLIVVGIWMWTGFAMVILSAGLKGISTELLEAARMDGANEFQVFFRIILPLLAPTIAVVATTIVITALKTFDIVYVMTGGRFGTEVIGTLFYRQLFTIDNDGAAAAVAIILLLAIVPVMLFNIRRFQAQEAIR
ncbi:MAG TPA: sugar ABC transporter permease [candidate division Zixibacteria bacterium]|nr:sugar ABC transporter permease [candidate division Zixibacteria bacterium]